MLNPAFNINHMREMTPVFYDVTHNVSRNIVPSVYLNSHIRFYQLKRALDDVISYSGSTEVDLVGWLGRTALELVGEL